jgi:hypothetical protein
MRWRKRPRMILARMRKIGSQAGRAGPLVWLGQPPRRGPVVGLLASRRPIVTRKANA